MIKHIHSAGNVFDGEAQGIKECDFLFRLAAGLAAQQHFSDRAHDMAFGDLSYFNIADRGTRSVRALHELYAGVGQVAFVAKERLDAKLILPEAVQILKMTGEAAQG